MKKRRYCPKIDNKIEWMYKRNNDERDPETCVSWDLIDEQRQTIFL